MNNHHLFPLATAILIVLIGCTTSPIDKAATISSAQSTFPPESPFFKANRTISFEDAGKLITIEGYQCTEQTHGLEAVTMLVTHDMPAYVDQSTVILNGWDLRYLQKDHEVRSLRADITHSKLITDSGDLPTLVFSVTGDLSDQKQNSAYEFCAYYTVLGFNSEWIDARIEGDHNGIDGEVLQSDVNGPIATLENSWKTGAPKSGDLIAVIPRGFDFQFTNKFECEWRALPCRWNDPVDHQLRQIAYSLFQTGASPKPNINPHWITQTIFKDNGVRTHRAKTRVALIGGNSVKLRGNPLPLHPQSGKTKNCHKNIDGFVRTETFRINDLPFDYAIPLLSGWNLDFACSEHPVQRAGIWIHDFHYDTETKVLEYKLSAIFRDKNGAPGFNAAHKISVLGLNRSASLHTTEIPSPKLKIKIRERQ